MNERMKRALNATLKVSMKGYMGAFKEKVCIRETVKLLQV